MLRRHRVAYTAVDNDALSVTADRAKGHAVYFGDATNPQFLKACGLMEASAVVVTIHTQAAIGEIVVRALRTSRSYLEAGALVTVDPNRNRIRLLPI